MWDGTKVSCVASALNQRFKWVFRNSSLGLPTCSHAHRTETSLPGCVNRLKEIIHPITITPVNRP